MLRLTDVLNELRTAFPQDSAKVTRFFAAALVNESKGDTEKAESFLEKAIAAEEEDRAAS